MREPHGGALRCSGFSELNDSFFSPPKRCILRCRDLLFKVISYFFMMHRSNFNFILTSGVISFA